MPADRLVPRPGRVPGIRDRDDEALADFKNKAWHLAFHDRERPLEPRVAGQVLPDRDGALVAARRELVLTKSAGRGFI